MTSQRDETVGHMTGDGMTDDPIVVERHDEILGGPVDDPEADDLAADDLAADEPAAGESAADDLAADEPASDELVGRHAAPDTRGTGPEEAPPPLVVPPETAPAGDFAGSSPAATAADPVTSDDPVTAADPATAAGSAAAAVPVTPAGSAAAAGAETVPGAGIAQAADTTGATAGSVPAAAMAGQQWPAIQALFVDDPKGSVERAAAAADEEVKAFVASLQREQDALRASWAGDASTEDLRTALQQYRAFCGRLEGLA